MAALNCCRVTLWGLSMTLMFFSMILTGIGIFAPAWWYLNVTEQVGGECISQSAPSFNPHVFAGLQMEWTFGLWMICRRGQTLTQWSAMPYSYRWMCDTRYRMDPSTTPYNNQTMDHYQTLVMLSFCLPYLSIAWGVGCLITASLVSSATTIFYIDANREEVRQFVSSSGRIYYVSRGASRCQTRVQLAATKLLCRVLLHGRVGLVVLQSVTQCARVRGDHHAQDRAGSAGGQSRRLQIW
ncbi:unnamed protein product [Sphagnum balticum]